VEKKQCEEIVTARICVRAIYLFTLLTHMPWIYSLYIYVIKSAQRMELFKYNFSYLIFRKVQHRLH